MVKPAKRINIEGIEARYYSGRWGRFDQDGYWVVGGNVTGATVMATEEEAIQRCRNTALIKTAEGMPLDRATYEAECDRFGVTCHSDEYIDSGSYSLRYGDFHLPEYSPSQIIERKLALRRLGEMERPSTAAAVPVSKPTLAECPRCHAQVSPSLMMAGSLGPLCPDCYDDAEGDL